MKGCEGCGVVKICTVLGVELIVMMFDQGKIDALIEMYQLCFWH